MQSPEQTTRLQTLLQSGQYAQAAQIFHEILEETPSADGFHNLGYCYSQIGEPEMAMAAYREATRLNPQFAPAHNNLATLYESAGKIDNAMRHYEAAAIAEPQSDMYAGNLARLRMAMGQYRESLQALRACGQTNLNRLYADLFKLSQDFSIDEQLISEVKACLSTVAIDPMDLTMIAQTIMRAWLPDDEAINSWQIMDEPLTRLALSSLPLQDPTLENALTTCRAQMLAHLLANNKGNDLWRGALAFLMALACQCFINEFVFYESADERTNLTILEDKLIKGKDLSLFDIAIYACYRPLHKLPRAAQLLQTLQAQAPLRSLVKMHLAEPLQEAEIRKNIKQITAIDDAISLNVKAQYEENPYPRWLRTSAYQCLPLPDILRYLFPYLQAGDFAHINAEKPSTLSAGCGTGKQPIDSALTFAHADITAIDISKASIGYATRKTMEYGLKNIRYALADILRLPELGKTFDVIQSTGVLHHMEVPEKGWQALCDVLKPGGFMLIALYSETARRPVVAARAYIAEQGYAADRDGIQECRRAITALPPEHPAKGVMRWMDFYTASNCRDLLFHVQEQRYTTLQIKSLIEKTGLRFLGFHLPNPKILAAYTARFAHDPYGLDLENWHAFEQDNPHTFDAMYHLWLQKPT